MYGAAQGDSVKVFFALNKATFNPELDNNAASMAKFVDSIVMAAHSGHLDSIVVYGYASPDGPFLNNDKLSAQRCNAVADYISRHAGIPLNKIRTSPEGIAWDGLRALVAENPRTLSRDKVLRILDRYVPAACTDQALSDQCVKSLMAIDDGRTYRWMIEHLFDQLRFALAIYTYTSPDRSGARPISEIVDSATEPTSAEDAAGAVSAAADAVSSAASVPSADSLSSSTAYVTSVSRPPLHRLAVKTNLLYCAALLPNLEVEWRVNDKWSVALEGGVAWWGDYSKNRSYRLAMVSSEVKYWIRPRAPWHGLYVGLFAGGGYYDFLKGSSGYYGDGEMGGLSVGYMWPVSCRLSFETAIGAGYLHSRYKEYIPLDGHHVYQRTKDLNYYGPLKVKFSLVWRLWDLNKPRRRNAETETTVRYEK